MNNIQDMELRPLCLIIPAGTGNLKWINIVIMRYMSHISVVHYFCINVVLIYAKILNKNFIFKYCMTWLQTLVSSF